MGITCKCIDASNKPDEIPQSKWVVEGEIYTILAVKLVTPIEIDGVHSEPTIGFELVEIDLDESNSPYDCFDSKRFGFKETDLKALDEMFKEVNPIPLLLEESFAIDSETK